MEAPAVHGGHAGNTRARGGGQVPAELTDRFESLVGKEGIHMLRKIVYSLGALAVLAMAVGAGFRPN